MMFYCVKSHQKFKILDTFNELLCYCGFALRPSIVYCKQRHISSIGCTDKLLKLTHFYGYVLITFFSKNFSRFNHIFLTFFLRVSLQPCDGGREVGVVERVFSFKPFIVICW